jgi:transposase
MPSWVQKRKSYTPKYRREAAHLVIGTGRTIAEVARDIGVGEALLGRWVAIERSRMDDPPEAVDADERAELERLRRENAELRMDREFLKKAAAYAGDVCQVAGSSSRLRMLA